MKPLISNNKILVIEHDDPSKVLKLGIYQLTHIGKQVLALTSFISNEAYFTLEVLKPNKLFKRDC